MERRRKLLDGEVDEAQIVEDLPVEWGQVGGALEAGDGSHELALAEEAHADVVPQLRGL